MTLADETDWVPRLKSAGDEKNLALEELRSILHRGLMAASRNRYNGKLQIDDVVQDALVRILEKLDTFEGRSKFTTWALTIATRMAISEMRRSHFKDVSLESLTNDSLRLEIAATNGPEHGQDEEKAAIISALRDLIQNDLTEKQRDAIQCLLHGMPVEVIAEKTGSNRNAIYKLVHDARLKLRQGLEQTGFFAEDFHSVFA